MAIFYVINNGVTSGGAPKIFKNQTFLSNFCKNNSIFEHFSKSGPPKSFWPPQNFDPRYAPDYDFISPDDVIFIILKCHHCVRGHISYGIRLQICVKSAINMVSRAQICVFGCFPYISNTKCLYKGSFTKTSLSTPVATTSETKTNIFLKLWGTLHTNKIGAMPASPRPRFFWKSSMRPI